MPYQLILSIFMATTCHTRTWRLRIITKQIPLHRYFLEQERYVPKTSNTPTPFNTDSNGKRGPAGLLGRFVHAFCTAPEKTLATHPAPYSWYSCRVTWSFCNAVWSDARVAPPSQVDLIGLEEVSTCFNVARKLNLRFILLTQALSRSGQRTQPAQVAGSLSP